MVSKKDFEQHPYQKYLAVISMPSLYSFAKPRIQQFSIPPDLILHIFFQKVSPLVLLKIYQTCKYFFKKCSILPIHHWIHCSKDSVFSTDTNPSRDFNFSPKVQFWFYGKKLCLDDTYLFIRQRIYRCTLRILSLYCFNIYIAEFEYLISESIIEDFEYHRSNILYPDDEIVPLHVILQKLPNCFKLRYESVTDKLSRNTLMALNDLKISKPFENVNFTMGSVSEDFDPTLFWNFMKNLAAPDSTFWIAMVIDDAFKMKLENAQKAVFADWNAKPPKIDIRPHFIYIGVVTSRIQAQNNAK